MCAALNIPTWNDAYTSEELGGLVGAALESHTSAGFAKFLMVVLVLSVVACNIVNAYSCVLLCHFCLFSKQRFTWDAGLGSRSRA